MRRAALLVLFLALSGCPALWGALPHIAAAAGWLGSVVDVADQAAELYSARHPSAERDAQVAVELRAARQALATLHEAILSEDPATIAAARGAMLDAYARLRMVLLDSGVLDAVPPAGGSETEAEPMPVPTYLPPVEDVSRALGGAP